MWINYIKENEVRNVQDIRYFTEFRHFVNFGNAEFILITEDIIEIRFVSGTSTRINKGERSFDPLQTFLMNKFKIDEEFKAHKIN